MAQFLPQLHSRAIPPSWSRTCRAPPGCGSPNTCPTLRRATAALIAITQPSIVQHKVLNGIGARSIRPTTLGSAGSAVSVTLRCGVAHRAGAERRRRQASRADPGRGRDRRDRAPCCRQPSTCLAGTKFTIVKGYKSAAEMGLAVERGEIHGSGSASFEYVNGKGWLDKKLARMLLHHRASRAAPRRRTRPRWSSSRPTRGARTSCGLRPAPPRSAARSWRRPALAPERRRDPCGRRSRRMVQDQEFIAEFGAARPRGRAVAARGHLEDRGG